MKDGDWPQALGESFDHLRGEGNFWQQYQRPPTAFKCFRDALDVDLGFSTAGDSMQKESPVTRWLQRSGDGIDRFFLLALELMRRRPSPQFFSIWNHMTWNPKLRWGGLEQFKHAPSLKSVDGTVTDRALLLEPPQRHRLITRGEALDDSFSGFLAGALA